MENHLHLNRTLWELDTIGNLTIFSDGKSVRLSTDDVRQLINWLEQKPEEIPLLREEKQFKLQSDNLQVTNNKTTFTIPRAEAHRAYNWLKKQRTNILPLTDKPIQQPDIFLPNEK